MQENTTVIKNNRNTQEEFIMKPYIDWCFKELMRNPKTREGFIAELLKLSPEQIGETVLLENELTRQTEEEKQGILDVHVLLKSGIQLDIEMQVVYQEHWDQRSLFYLSKMFTNQLKKGEDYDQLHKCVQVSVLNFTYFKDDQICYRKFQFRDDETGRLYSDKMEIQILELTKIPEEHHSPGGVIAWMKFFRGGDKKEMKEMAKGNTYLEEAYEDLLEMSQDEEKRMFYDVREKAIRDELYRKHQAEKAMERGFEKGWEKGREEGREEGRKEGRKEGREEGREEGRKEGRKQAIIDFYRKDMMTLEQAAREYGVTVEEFRKLL